GAYPSVRRRPPRPNALVQPRAPARARDCTPRGDGRAHLLQWGGRRATSAPPAANSRLEPPPTIAQSLVPGPRPDRRAPRLHPWRWKPPSPPLVETKRRISSTDDEIGTGAAPDA